ncbi:hypothetical protein [Eisenibacter elegans]|jgi:archaellum component FlaC|uniref:hypothetical protein n=1 Tax=Eisenibacter elegans TaxID=997 RepID=UPI00041D13FF|nr:hypothetical protein [Eisenibacter elegans]
MSDHSEKTFFQDFGQQGNGRSNVPIIVISILALLLVVSLIFNYTLASKNTSSTRELNEQKESMRTLQTALTTTEAQMEELREEQERLLDSLETQRNVLESKVDSVNRLLNFARRDAQGSKARVAQLEKELKALKGQLAEVQQKYEEAVELNASIAEEYRTQIEQLNLQIQSYDAENQQLRAELEQFKGSADNRTALFTTLVIATPGRNRNNGNFDATYNRRRVEAIEVKYRLSRAPRPTENIAIRLFDPNNQEITVSVQGRSEVNADPVSKTRLIAPEAGFSFGRGNYEVRIYAIETGKEGSVEIGRAKFELK